MSSASGSLYGDSSLLGGNAPLPDLDKSGSAIVKDPKFVDRQKADAKLGGYLDFDDKDVPQPMRGGLGATGPDPRTHEKLGPDLYAPPGANTGDVPNAMWPLGLSYNRLGSQASADKPNNRIKWSSLLPPPWLDEWSLITNGCVRVAAINDEGKSFIDDLCAGDVWFFPEGIPHTLQALDQGVEFLLLFDQGDSSEDGTFLVSELFLQNPF
ncbi:Fc.00g004220.m01.CDS01 [Cosmosporella sp. VM-42]